MGVGRGVEVGWGWEEGGGGMKKGECKDWVGEGRRRGGRGEWGEEVSGGEGVREREGGVSGRERVSGKVKEG